MTDMEKRAHDIAVRILPYTLKEFDPEFFYLDRKDHGSLSSDVLEEYVLLYEELLKGLEEHNGF